MDTSFRILSDLVGTIDILNVESLIDVELADSEVPPRKQGKLCLDQLEGVQLPLVVVVILTQPLKFLHREIFVHLLF